MTLPAGIEIGAVLVAKRGRRVPEVTVRMIHRPDHSCSVITADGQRKVIHWREIRKNYRVT
jgi:hypothetical protein